MLYSDLSNLIGCPRTRQPPSADSRHGTLWKLPKIYVPFSFFLGRRSEQVNDPSAIGSFPPTPASIRSFPQIKHYGVQGRSRGGGMAAK